VKHTPILSVSLLTLILEPLNAWAQQSPSNYRGPHMMWESGWMFLGPLMMIAFIAIVVVVVVLLVRWLGGHRPSAHVSSESRAADILKERFARGEIDKEEYEERRRILRD
jgi:putative membrane protein